MGSGPYKFHSWKTGREIELIRDLNYWGYGKAGVDQPFVDRHRYRIINNMDAALVTLKSGGLDEMGLTPIQHVRGTTADENTADENTADENTSDENTDDGDTPGEAFTPVFHAAGNEPSWGVDLTDSTMTFRTPEGSRTSPVQEPVQAGDSTRYVSEDGTWSLSILEQPCTDTMSGLRYPNTVRVSMDDRTMSGCGGDPAGLLQGETWVVEDIDGGGIIDRSRVTIEFGDDGRVSGMASCNQYSANLARSAHPLHPSAQVSRRCRGARMSIITLMTTMMLWSIAWRRCPPPFQR
jgi:uncharacterized membrane protein